LIIVELSPNAKSHFHIHRPLAFYFRSNRISPDDLRTGVDSLFGTRSFSTTLP
jgi:hypothetical protein